MIVGSNPTRPTTDPPATNTGISSPMPTTSTETRLSSRNNNQPLQNAPLPREALHPPLSPIKVACPESRNCSRCIVQSADTGSVKFATGRRAAGSSLLHTKGKLFLLAVLFLGAIWTAPFPMVHASPVATSLPGVKAGDNATYVITHYSFQTTNPTAFPNPFGPSNITPLATIRILSVQGANVTFTTNYTFPNGTSYVAQTQYFVAQTTNLDVQTQSSCNIQSTTQQRFCGPETPLAAEIIAAGLQAPEAIGANPSITLNQTVTRTILGVLRTVNIMNTTINFSSGGYSQSVSYGWTWDQASGIAVGLVGSFMINTSQGSESLSFSIVIVSTNIWTGSAQDFNITSNPSTITSQKGEVGSSTVILTSVNGFTGTVSLQTSTSSHKLSCSLTKTSVVLDTSSTSSSTISCSGSEGTYTVTVMATAKNLSHSTTLTYTIQNEHRGHDDDNGHHRHHDDDEQFRHWY